METNNIQNKIKKILELKEDISLLHRLKEKLNPNKAYSQEIIRAINEEISFMAYHKSTILKKNKTQIEKYLEKLQTGSNESTEKSNKYIPFSPPTRDILSAHKLKQKDVPELDSIQSLKSLV